MFGYIYITTNLINNKKYIGRHESSEYDSTYYGSGAWLNRSLKKYGIENFKNEILESINNVPTICNSFEELCESEKYYIDYYDCVNSDEYYNLVPGGKGNSVKGSKRVNDGTKVKQLHPSEVESFLAENKGWKQGGLPSKPESIQKRVEKVKGKKHSEEWNRNISLGHQGKLLSNEHKQRLSDSHRGKLSWNAKKIQCVETGQVFDSMRKAAEYVHRDAGNIHYAIKHNTPCAEYHWRYYEV